MTKVSPETILEKDENKSNWQNVLAFLTMPFEGIFFFGAILGFTNLAEILKQLKVYEDLCDLAQNDTKVTDSGIINCPERDTIFS